jgi:hypothetical protein
MKQYTATFESVGYYDWTIEANSLEEAKEKAENISDYGIFVDEHDIEYVLVEVVPNDEDIIEKE